MKTRALMTHAVMTRAVRNHVGRTRAMKNRVGRTCDDRAVRTCVVKDKGICVGSVCCVMKPMIIPKFYKLDK
jgi:hypothetical protein